MGVEEFIIQRSREIFVTNEFAKLREEYKKLRDFALINNTEDKSYIAYLEIEFNNCMEGVINKVSSMQ